MTTAPLTITRCSMVPTDPRLHARPHVAEVDATGPRGGDQEYTVTFNRDGSIRHALRTFPPARFYSCADEMPREIAAAACEAYASGLA